MRVAFVSGNREQLPDAVIPLGLLCVAASVPARHEKTLLDLCFEERPFEAQPRALPQDQPQDVQVAGPEGHSDPDVPVTWSLLLGGYDLAGAVRECLPEDGYEVVEVPGAVLIRDGDNPIAYRAVAVHGASLRQEVSMMSDSPPFKVRSNTILEANMHAADGPS